MYYGLDIRDIIENRQNKKEFVIFVVQKQEDMYILYLLYLLRWLILIVIFNPQMTFLQFDLKITLFVSFWIISAIYFICNYFLTFIIYLKCFNVIQSKQNFEDKVKHCGQNLNDLKLILNGYLIAIIINLVYLGYSVYQIETFVLTSNIILKNELLLFSSLICWLIKQKIDLKLSNSSTIINITKKEVYFVLYFILFFNFILLSRIFSIFIN